MAAASPLPLRPGRTHQHPPLSHWGSGTRTVPKAPGSPRPSTTCLLELSARVRAQVARLSRPPTPRRLLAGKKGRPLSGLPGSERPLALAGPPPLSGASRRVPGFPAIPLPGVGARRGRRPGSPEDTSPQRPAGVCDPPEVALQDCGHFLFILWDSVVSAVALCLEFPVRRFGWGAAGTPARSAESRFPPRS